MLNVCIYVIYMYVYALLAHICVDAHACTVINKPTQEWQAHVAAAATAICLMLLYFLSIISRNAAI